MARVQGPLHSDTASGTLGGSIVFGHWKGGRAYVRTHVIPKNPKASKQTGVRSMFGFLAHAWANIAALTQATYTEIAAATSISAFNAYMAANQNRWKNFLAPQKEYNDAEASTGLTVTTQATTGGVKTATVVVTPSGSTSIWGIAIFRGVTGFTPSWANCVAVIETDSADPITFVDTLAEAGSYFYRAMVFNVDGVKGTIHAEAEAVVT